MLGTKKKEETLPVNEALLNVITPMGLEIKRNSLVIGENMGKVYGAVRYPQKVEMGWLSKITNIPSTTMDRIRLTQTSSFSIARMLPNI